MGKLEKQLKKFTKNERKEIEHFIERITKLDFTGLDFKKLKGLKNIFRVRKGKIRIVFELESGKEPLIMSVERR